MANTQPAVHDSSSKSKSNILSNHLPSKDLTPKFIDLFCGIGGFRIAADSLGWECVLSCDIDEEAQKAYAVNFGDTPEGDIHNVASAQVPDHDVLIAGFPCQPFSIIGERKGFQDTRGTLFFEIARILRAKTPTAFVLENVKQLVGHNGGRTITRMMEILRNLGYRNAEYRVFNALDFGLPQKRERVVIAGVYGCKEAIPWPEKFDTRKSLNEILQRNVGKKYYASKAIMQKRLKQHKSKYRPAIWHENKAGHISSYPFSCALRAGASYNYLLVDGVRRLTPREMLRLQGFPDSFKIACNDHQTRKQAGNSVPVPLVKAVLSRLQPMLLKHLSAAQGKSDSVSDKI